MPTNKITGNKLADMMYGNPEGAAFGFFPQMGRRGQNKPPRGPQPQQMIVDDRAMELPQSGDFDLSVPSAANKALGERILDREIDLKRQADQDMSPLEKLAGGMQAGRLIGSGLVQAVKSIPIAVTQGGKAAEDYIAKNIYKPNVPKAYEYAGDVSDFLTSLETDYKIPPIMPEALALQFLAGPATKQAGKAANRGALDAAMRLERGMEPIVNRALEGGGLPREMAQAMGANTQSNVVRPTGSNIFTKDLEQDLKSLKTNVSAPQNIAELNTPTPQRQSELALNKWIDSNLGNYVKKQMGTPDDPVRKLAEEGIVFQNTIDPPANYGDLAKRRMKAGFPAEGMGESEMAKAWEQAADESIANYRAGDIQAAPENLRLMQEALSRLRVAETNLDANLEAKLTEKGLSQQEIAQMIKHLPDDQKAIIAQDSEFTKARLDYNAKRGNVDDFETRLAFENPWVSKLDPEERIYQPYSGSLGFDHIIDVLREDLTTGRIRPEQLNKVSIEQAVRRTAEYDKELAEKMNAAKAAQREGLPVYKEYPEGFRWVELNKPGSFASESESMGHSVRGYEPPKGHPDWTEASGDSGSRNYGHGGWEAIKSGKAKVYSLVDSKGEPHTTVEVAQVEKHPIGYSLERGVEFPKDFRYERGSITPEQKQQIYQRAKELFDPASTKGLTDFSQHRMDVFQQAADEVIGKPPDMITQIKGKSNRAPNKEYLPYVQDFVKSGRWSDVDDLRNTGLRPTSDAFNETEQAFLRSKGVELKPYIDPEETARYQELFKRPPAEGMARGGRVHISDNPDVMQLELAGGGLVKAASNAAVKALKPAKEAAAPIKASEALGRIEGRPLVITQADRTKVGGGYLGGPGFSGLQLEDPAYRAAEAAWAVKNPGVAKMILGGSKDAGKDPVYAAMLGTPTQHQSNQMVFDKLYGDFKKAAKKGNLDQDLRDRINMRLVNTVDKEGNNIFPPDVDILGKNFKDLANTFDRRAVTANLIGGMGVGGKKGQIIDYDKIIRQTTDPLLIDAPTGALGNRLFTLSGGIIDRPDLHPAFPTIMQGEDLGVSFNPVARDLIMKDFTEKTMREKGRAPGYMDYTRGYPPSQIITEDILTEMQKLGFKEGGAVQFTDDSDTMRLELAGGGLVKSLSKGLFSAVDKTAQNLKRPAGTGKEFMAEIKASPGIKATELKGRKLAEIEALPKMTKDQFIKELEARPPVKIEEKVLGQPSQKEIDELADKLAYDKSVESARYYGERGDDIDALAEENYLFNIRNNLEEFREEARQSLIDEGQGGPFHENKFTIPGGKNYREILLKAPAAKGEGFLGTPAHFGGEPNILASIRVSDRTGPNGEKILHVEEIQSDWHQAGRKKGYKEEYKSRFGDIDGQQMKVSDLIAQQGDAGIKWIEGKNSVNRDLDLPELAGDDLINVVTENGAPVLIKEARFSDITKMVDSHRRGVADLEAQERQLFNKSQQEKLPDAPFKKDWQELALRRVMQEAAEGGYDRVVLTKGAEQADRYDLSKQVGRITYTPDINGGTLKATDLGNQNYIITETNVTPDRLEALIGKEAAQKLVDAPLEGGSQTLSGEGLKVGGEGMAGFYDKMLPDYLNKLGKQYGVEVSPVTIAHPKNSGTTYNAIPPLTSTDFHGFEVTPQMRQDITEKGQPLYQQIGIPVGAGTASTGTATIAPEGLGTNDEQQVQNPVNFTENPDAMLLEMMQRN